jgi:aspartyl/asparaginyl-tRNA synthetase
MDFPKLTVEKLSQLSSIAPNVPLTVDGRVHRIHSGYPDSVTEIVLRHDGYFVAAALHPGITDQEAVDKAASLTVESLLRVSGVILPKHEGQVNGAVTASIKIQVSSLTIISEAKEGLPSVTVSHGGPGEIPHPQEMCSSLINQRLDNRVIDVRVAATAAIFKLSSGVHYLTVQHLNEHEFHWVATPKLISYRIPGDDDYFEVPYMNGLQARLSQTSEIHLGLALAADMERVYDIHTAFRRELAVSPRHLTEVRTNLTLSANSLLIVTTVYHD